MPGRVTASSFAYTPSSSSTPTLQQGSSGTAVADLQRRLAAAGFSPGAVDGSFGPKTAAAVTQFQRARGLSVDGVVGPNTWGALKGTSAKPPTTGAPTGSHPSLSQGARGPDVVEMQQGLARAGFSPGAADGDFGPQTAAALRRFQVANGVGADGVCGPRTWAVLGGDSFGAPSVTPVSSPGSSSGLRQNILQIASGQVGTAEASNRNDGAVLKYPGLFGRGSEAYCADFVSWVSTKAGKPLNVYNCNTMRSDLKASGDWKGKNNPQPGDIVLFDFNGDGSCEHVGFVESVNANGSVNTIEGNTGNPSNGQEGVWRRTRPMSEIAGFGNP
jgi:peptidoglycan hydrolase-like protein with peptidoglycan-binding domain